MKPCPACRSTCQDGGARFVAPRILATCYADLLRPIPRAEARQGLSRIAHVPVGQLDLGARATYPNHKKPTTIKQSRYAGWLPTPMLSNQIKAPRARNTVHKATPLRMTTVLSVEPTIPWTLR
jgi:hypothetical protein